MKLAVSNIAWTNEEEPAVAQLLQKLGVKYIEVAPTKKWHDPTTEANSTSISEYKHFWLSYGIEIVAFQSMLFPRPELQIFETEELRNQTLAYLKSFISLAPKFGAGIMVFGSPKNRHRGRLSNEEATEIAEPFFEEIGRSAQDNKTCFCIEPNPEAYNCDFVTNAQQGIDLVSRVDNPGFGLHLDIAGMTLANDNITESIIKSQSILRHFHISAPYLEQVEESNGVDYKTAAAALKSINYDRFVSIEMKPANFGNNVARIEKAVRLSQQIFDA